MDDGAAAIMDGLESWRTLLRHAAERSSAWMNLIAAIVAIASDLLHPLLQHFTPWLLVLALAVVAGLATLMRVHWLSVRAGAAALAFCIVISVLFGGLAVAQWAMGDPPDGAIAQLLPAVKHLQRSLDIAQPKIDALNKKLDRDIAAADRNSATNLELAAVNLKLAESYGALAGAIARKKGIPAEAVERILARIGATRLTSDPNEIEQVLNEKADEYIALRTELAALSAVDPKARALQRAAEADFAHSDFDAARKKLHEASAIDRAAVAELASRAKARAKDAANSLERSAGIASVALQYASAAQDLADAADIQKPYDARQAWRLTEKQAQVLELQGEEFGDNTALDRSIAVYRTAIPMAQSPDDRATTENNLGNALWSLGLRQAGTARLEQAVAAYRSALVQSPRAKNPVKWAGRENNLALVLVEIGDRTDDPSRFAESADALRTVAAIYATAHQPADVAMAENNLAGVLVKTAERTNDLKTANEAVAACEEALKGYSEADDPLDWAMTENSLAMAIQIVGKLAKNPVLFERSIVTLHAAQRQYTRTRDPLDWAMTEDNMGEVLIDLNAYRKGDAELQQAIGHIGNSLKEFSRERSAPAWARAEFDLGTAYDALYARDRDDAALSGAAAAYANALSVLKPADAPFFQIATKALAADKSRLATRKARKI